MIIIVDSDGLVGSLNSEDFHYPIASQLVEKLVRQGAQFLYPATTIVESTTLLQGRLNKPELAEKLKDFIQNDKLDIVLVDNALLKHAVSLMDSGTTKHHTLFDAVVAAVAKENKADAIFSFDKFYKSKGFKLASEL
jgi:predicted nucleic acid-binding protein